MKNYFQLRHNNNQQQPKGERFYFFFYQENLKVHEGIGRRPSFYYTFIPERRRRRKYKNKNYLKIQ